MSLGETIPAGVRPVLREEELTAAFRGRIQPVRVSWSYRLGILLVAVVMILLPLVYLAIIGLVGFAVYYHATHHTALVTGVRGRGMFLAVLLYLAPMVVGGILVVFMFKPFFSRPARRPRRRRLSRQDEPLLFALVDQICGAVGAPRPREIHVDCEVNASASFRRGLWSMFGSDLALTIGMPLVMGLTLRQFAGVLAHEFGHFSQGAGMRMTYLIRSISHWFTRVVYERDSWDRALVQWSEGIDLRIGWILYLSRLFVWLTRQILWVLMMVGHAVSGYMLRQMEFDADRYEARLAGSETFAQTARRLNELNAASQAAQTDLGNYYREGRLGDDLPRLIQANALELSEEVQRQIDRQLQQSETAWFHTHPADKDRIASARREDAPGIFFLDRPASDVFQDASATCRAVTGDFYDQVFEGRVQQQDLQPIDQLLAHKHQLQASMQALRRYFQDTFSLLRPLPMTSWQLPQPHDLDRALGELRQSRQRLLDQRDTYQAAMTQYDQADTVQIEVQQAKSLLRAQFKIRPQDFSRPLTCDQEAAFEAQSTRRRMTELGSQLLPYEQLASTRLMLALGLLEHPVVASRLEDADLLAAETRQLLACLQLLQQSTPRAHQIRDQHAVLAVLLGNLEQNRQNQTLIDGIREQMQILHGHLHAVRSELDRQPYPFDHAQGPISLGRYVLETLPGDGDLGGIYEAAGSSVQTIYQLTARVMGRLCQIAELSEEALGLPPLPEPPSVETAEAAD